MSIVSVDNIQPIGSGTSVTVNSAATLVLNNVNSTGVVTATSFVGSGANLTSLPSQISFNNASADRILTSNGGTSVNAEANLTMTGNVLQFNCTANTHGMRFVATGDHYNTISFDSNRSAADAFLNVIDFKWDGDKVADIVSVSGSDTTNKDDGNLVFRTSPAQGSIAERLRITQDGKIGINENTPSNTLHVSGTTGTTAGGLLRLDAATGDNFILFDNTSDSTEWAVGYDSTTRSKFDIWYDNNSSGYDLKFSVDGATGAVRKPKNPVFIAYRVNAYNSTTSPAVLVYDSVQVDIGSNYSTSNGRFTAPVTGLYEFAYAAIASNYQTVYRYDLRVNGALPYNPLILELRIDQNNQTAYGTNGEYVCYVQMTAGQYAQVYVHSDNTVNNVYGSSSYGYTYFRGRLIG